MVIVIFMKIETDKSLVSEIIDTTSKIALNSTKVKRKCACQCCCKDSSCLYEVEPMDSSSDSTSSSSSSSSDSKVKNLVPVSKESIHNNKS